METKTLLALLDEYDAAWGQLNSGSDSASQPNQAKSDFRPLFMRVADISFKIIEAYQQQMGTHAIPVTSRKDNRLDTDAIRTEVAKRLADA